MSFAKYGAVVVVMMVVVCLALYATVVQVIPDSIMDDAADLVQTAPIIADRSDVSEATIMRLAQRRKLKRQEKQDRVAAAAALSAEDAADLLGCLSCAGLTAEDGGAVLAVMAPDHAAAALAAMNAEDRAAVLAAMTAEQATVVPTADMPPAKDAEGALAPSTTIDILAAIGNRGTSDPPSKHRFCQCDAANRPYRPASISANSERLNGPPSHFKMVPSRTTTLHTTWFACTWCFSLCLL